MPNTPSHQRCLRHLAGQVTSRHVEIEIPALRPAGQPPLLPADRCAAGCLDRDLVQA